MKVAWSARALLEVRLRALSIAADDPGRATQWVVSLREAVTRLRDFPRAGRVVPEFDDDGVREIIVGEYRVIYRLRETVEVAAVVHGSLPLSSDHLDEG